MGADRAGSRHFSTRRQSFLRQLRPEDRRAVEHIIIPWYRLADVSHEEILRRCREGEFPLHLPLLDSKTQDRDRRHLEVLYIKFLEGAISLRQLNGDNRVHDSWKLVLSASDANDNTWEPRHRPGHPDRTPSPHCKWPRNSAIGRTRRGLTQDGFKTLVANNSLYLGHDSDSDNLLEQDNWVPPSDIAATDSGRVSSNPPEEPESPTYSPTSSIIFADVGEPLPPTDSQGSWLCFSDSAAIKSEIRTAEELLVPKASAPPPSAAVRHVSLTSSEDEPTPVKAAAVESIPAEPEAAAPEEPEWDREAAFQRKEDQRKLQREKRAEEVSRKRQST